MASPFIEIPVGDRLVKVTNPDKVYFPEHGYTKRQLVEYYLAVGEGILRATRDRPTTLERWPAGVFEGARMATREDYARGQAGMGAGKSDAFYQKRIPKGAPDWVRTARIAFPSGRSADEVCPTEVAVIAWAANLGTLTFHPWPVRKGDVDHPDELRIDLDPQPGTDFSDAVRVALGPARDLLAELGYTGYVKTSGKGGVHIYVRIEPRWTFTEVRRAALAFGREVERRAPAEVTTKWWKEEQGRAGVHRLQPERQGPHDRFGLQRPAAPHAPVSAPVTWDELPDVDPHDFTIATMPARFAEVGDLHAAIDDASFSLEALLDMADRDEKDHGLGDMPYPPNYPKMPGEPKRVQPSKDTGNP
ncbi:DNA polymerase domain-containing protein [Actinomadura luteofluorescens]|uniref:DNA polymerase domain-containing protein n=1 Tax=Actinomadura luteofluorescens TaxID=46163 RepID=UPI0036322172